MIRSRSKKRGLRAFLRDGSGSLTVEFVIWMPVFLFVLATMADGAALFIRQANMWNVARDAARGMATGRFTACSSTSPANGATTDARAYALGQLLFNGTNYTVSCWFPTGTANATANSCANSKSTTNTTSNDIVEICIPFRRAGLFGVMAIFGGMLGKSFNVQVEMLSET